jgi:hypothetical protein
LRWFRPGYWSWRWRTGIGRETRAVAAIAGIAAVGVAGFLAAGGLAGDSRTETDFLETTVQEVVTVRERGRIVQRPVQVVRRVQVTTQTAEDGTQVITRRIVSTVPVVRRQVVTRNGVPRTVVETLTRTQGRTVTDTREATVTNRQTVTDQRVVTTERVVTTVRTVTDVETETVPTTVTQTQTRTETVTVPAPPVTITVSLP